MKTRLILTLAFLTGFTLLAAEERPQRLFGSLAEAVKALDTALAGSDRAKALNTLLPDGKTYFSVHPEVVKMLLREHKRTEAFTKLYKDRHFPSSGDTFKLGGHASELGHIHIDFDREGESWRLKDIWNCR